MNNETQNPQNLEIEFKELLIGETQELSWQECPRFRGPEAMLDLIFQAILVGSSLGAFGGLWKVLELFERRHSNLTIRLIFQRKDGSTAEMAYSHLNERQATQIRDDFLAHGLPRILVGVHKFDGSAP